MSRRIEGTTLGGFKCDAVGCVDNAVYSPIIVVPYKNPAFDDEPIFNFTDTHVCLNHWSHVRAEAALTGGMREACRAVAANRLKIEPDFDRAYLSRIMVHDGDYHKFQQASGLIGDDAMVKPVIVKAN